MIRSAIALDGPEDPRPTTTAPVGALLLPPGAIREGLRGYPQRRDALLAAAQAKAAEGKDA